LKVPVADLGQHSVIIPNGRRRLNALISRLLIRGGCGNLHFTAIEFYFFVRPLDQSDQVARALNQATTLPYRLTRVRSGEGRRLSGARQT